LPDPNPADLPDLVVETLQMLDIHRCQDIDAVVEQNAHVLPALFALGTRNIRMREFIDNADFRMPRQNRFRIHVREAGALVGSNPPGNNFERFSLRDRVRPSVRLEVANHYVAAAALEFIRLLEHLVSLAYACGVT